MEDSVDFDIKEFYTPLHVAKGEVWERWNNKKLRQKAEELIGDIPDIFDDKPKAIIFRNIATPNLEIKIAREYAAIMELDLVVIEFTVDKFCTRNRDKLHLGKMVFVDDEDRSRVVSKEKIISIKEDDNKRLCDINTLKGENLVDFHNRLFEENGYKDVKRFDASVYKKMGLSPYELYLKILGFCTHSAVLLENFLVKTDAGEKKFTKEVVVPAFFCVEKMLGHRPIIVPLMCLEEEGVNWQCYPREIEESVIKTASR